MRSVHDVGLTWGSARPSNDHDPPRRDIHLRTGQLRGLAVSGPRHRGRRLVPADRDCARPHGRRDRLGAFAERFAAAGVAALVFDHRGFGDSTGEPDLVVPAVQLADWRAAIAFARALPGVDASRIASDYNAIRHAATLHCPW